MESTALKPNASWHYVCYVADFPQDGGTCALIDGKQIAIFNFTAKNEWYATQNLCPHRQQMVLARGMIGTQNGEPKVACPFHKKTYSLKTGLCLSGDDFQIQTYPVKIVNGKVYVMV